MEYWRYVFLVLLLVSYGEVGVMDAVAAESEFLQIQAAVDLTTKQYIDGVSRFEREKYFNLHDSGSLPPERPGSSHEVLMDLWVDELNLTFGRWGVGGSSNIVTNVPEDPNRPGYVDPAWFETVRTPPHSSMLLQSEPDRIDLIFTGGGIPDFMVGEGITNSSEKWQRINAIKDPEAYADYLARLFRSRIDAGWQGSHFELFNEPTGWWYTDFDHLADLHAAAAQTFRQLVPEVQVGGPCFFEVYVFGRDFQRFRDGMQRFIDRAGADLDNLAFHFYDFYPQDYAESGFATSHFYSSGGRDEAYLDLLENYSMNQFQRVLPLFSTEFGGYDGSLSEVASPENEDQQNWYMINSVNRKMMTFFNRPTTVVKVVPFILGYTGWNTDYYSATIRPDGNGYRVTSLANFFRFWRDAAGDRVVSGTSDHNLAVVAFVDQDTVYVSMDNFYEHPVSVDLDLLVDDYTRIKQVEYRRLFFDREERQPHLSEYASLDLSAGPIVLAGHEKIMLKLSLDQPVTWQQAANEIWYYGPDTILPIRSQQSQTFDFSLDAAAGEPVYAALRIGMGRAHHLSRTPQVWVNGHPLEVPSYDWGGSQTRFEAHFTVREVHVPVELLQLENTVEVRFPDDGGDISTVIMRVGHGVDSSVFGPYTEAYYKENMLPEEFSLLAPAVATDEIDPTKSEFRWQTAPGAVSYVLYIAADDSFEERIVETVSQETVVVVDSLAHQREYFWKVRAIGADELPEMELARYNASGPWSFTTKAANSLPEVPVITTVRAGFDRILVEWSGCDQTDHYSVWRQGASEEEYTLVATDLRRSQLHFTDWRVNQGETYIYRVEASNHLGTSGLSQTMAVSVPVPVAVVEDDFDGEFDSNWRTQGAWSFRNGFAHLRALFPRAFGSISIDQDLGPSYALEYRMRAVDWGNSDLAVVRLTLNMQGNDRYQLIYWHRTRQIELMRRTSAGGVTVASVPFSLRTGEWNVFQLQNAHGILELYINGVLALAFTDPEPLGPGQTELYVTNLGIDFDYISIYGSD